MSENNKNDLSRCIRCNLKDWYLESLKCFKTPEAEFKKAFFDSGITPNPLAIVVCLLDSRYILYVNIHDQETMDDLLQKLQNFANVFFKRPDVIFIDGDSTVNVPVSTENILKIIRSFDGYTADKHHTERWEDRTYCSREFSNKKPRGLVPYKMPAMLRHCLRNSDHEMFEILHKSGIIETLTNGVSVEEIFGAITSLEMTKYCLSQQYNLVSREDIALVFLEMMEKFGFNSNMKGKPDIPYRCSMFASGCCTPCDFFAHGVKLAEELDDLLMSHKEELDLSDPLMPRLFFVAMKSRLHKLAEWLLRNSRVDIDVNMHCDQEFPGVDADYIPRGERYHLTPYQLAKLAGNVTLIEALLEKGAVPCRVYHPVMDVEPPMELMLTVIMVCACGGMIGLANKYLPDDPMKPNYGESDNAFKKRLPLLLLRLCET